MTVIIDDLTIRLPLLNGGVVHAVTRVSLTLEQGRIHAVVGESGCGKSMIAQALTGMLPRSAKVTGNITYEGQSIFGRERELAGRNIALIPQSAATFLTPVRTVGSQLTETVTVLGGPLTPSELMSHVDLSPTALSLYPHELSGGMAQRAAVAFALAGNPQVIIADEPTASLDPDLTVGLLRLLRRTADAGAAVILITHDIAELIDSGAADTVSVMYASRMVESGQARDILAGGAKERYTRDLLAALPRNGLHMMPGVPPVLTDLPETYNYAARLSAAGAL